MNTHHLSAAKTFTYKRAQVILQRNSRDNTIHMLISYGRNFRNTDRKAAYSIAHAIRIIRFYSEQ